MTPDFMKNTCLLKRADEMFHVRVFVCCIPVGDRSYDSRDNERYHRTPVRSKPIMISVEQPPPPRERKSTSAACVLASNQPHYTPASLSIHNFCQIGAIV